MAKNCDKCGAVVSDKARFCGKCGQTLGVAPVSPASGEQIPVWSGWEVPSSSPAPVAAVPQGQQTASVRFSKPAAPAPQPTSPAVAPTSYAAAPSPTAAYSGPVTSYPSHSTVAGQPANGGNATPCNNAPQFWESYDFESILPGQTQAYSPSASDVPIFEPRSDASRPLPKLGDVMAGIPGGQGNDDLVFSEDIDDDLEARRAKAYDTVTTFSLWCAGLVLLPMPFLDIVFLLPIQSAMVIAVGKVYGVKQTPDKVIATLAGVCGLTVFGQITTLALANCLPIVGKLLSAPFVFGWSYGMGEVAIRFFESKGKATKSELKQIFKKASKEASKHFDKSKVNAQEALDNIRNYVSEDEYRKIRERFGPHEG